MGCGNCIQQAPHYSAQQSRTKDSPGAPPKVILGAEQVGNNDLKMVKNLSENDANVRVVMDRYRMGLKKSSLMGEGASSICRKGTDMSSGEAVAIKVYKDKLNAKESDRKLVMRRFTRQIDVLKELLEPLKPGNDPSLWHPALATVNPSSLFMVLLDYSKSADGSPGAASDGVVYVVTELAQFSLKDFITKRREAVQPLSLDTIKAMTRAIILVTAGLHAKGLVHIDLKPENLMVFKGRVKLIDVDGCVKIGTSISISDPTISFSPCYCSPEWALFLIDDKVKKITARPGLDVWSVGMTVCELVSLKPIMKSVYLNFLRNSHSHQETGFLFLEYLSHGCSVPASLQRGDKGFFDLVDRWLVVSNQSERKSCAQCLDHPYVFSDYLKDLKEQEVVVEGEDLVLHTTRARPVDDSPGQPLYKGRLWKLNANGNPNDAAHWLKRDMWLGQQGSLCYFSPKENKRLVLIDAAQLADAEIKPHQVSGAQITRTKSSSEWVAFDVKWVSDNEEQVTMLAADSQEHYDEWLAVLSGAARMDMPTMRLGDDITQLRQFVMRVQNRRKIIPSSHSQKEQFEPVYKERLWKLKADGDRSKADDWFEREMWIARNGSLVYYSMKEERNLVYYTGADLMRATYAETNPREGPTACRPFTFQVHLPKMDQVEFAPGEFAANTKEQRDKWIEELTGATKRISENPEKK